ncbi:hypothetical protein [Paenibacillus sp. OV219]|nr:hypothetical protein [Paenibacillus sp. OV219]
MEAVGNKRWNASLLQVRNDEDFEGDMEKLGEAAASSDDVRIASLS